MIFHEIYSAYYNAVAKILAALVNEDKTEKQKVFFGVYPYFFLYDRIKNDKFEKPQVSAASDTLYSPLCSLIRALVRRTLLR